MSDGIWVVPPEWKVEGGGGGGTSGTVSWGDIENKPTEFKPRPHKHEIEDVNNLESALYNKVEKEIGKGLSTNDFTNEDKDKLDSLGGDSSSYVQSVNNMSPDKSGNVNVTKEQIGLGLIENKQYTPMTDFENHIKDNTKHVTSELVAKIDNNTANIANSVKKEEFETEVSRLDEKVESANTDLSAKINENSIALQGKVDSVDGKGLSSNDFTDEDKFKLDNLISSEDKLVKTVNSKTPDNLGNIEVTKEDLGLGNVLNIEQASKAELEDLSTKLKKNSEDLSDLSTQVQTNKNEIALINDKIENTVFPDEIVTSVNGETGEVTIDKNTLGLSNVLNKEQATKEELTEFQESNAVALIELAKTLEGYTDKEVASEADRTNSKLIEKVDKELGKGLSSNDFTKEYKDKLDSVDTSKKYVQTINDVAPDTQGNIKVDKSSVGLSKLENKDYTPLDDFTSYKSSTEASLALKVDKVEGKQLSTNDYTTEDKNKLANLPSEIDTGVMTVNSVAPDEKGNLELDFVTSETLKSHTGNSDIHLSEDDRDLIAQVSNKVDKEPNKQLSTNDFTDDYKTKIDTNSNEIEAIKELLGNGEEPIELPPAFKVYKEGHIYGLGGIIYDIVNNNIVTGSLAPRFVYDNPEFFDDSNFVHNTINVYYDGNVFMLDNINDEDSVTYKGKLTNILDRSVRVTAKNTINGVGRESEDRIQYIGNTFNIPVRHLDIFAPDEERGKASVGLDIENAITFKDTDGAFIQTTIINNTIVNNTFTFAKRKEYIIRFKSELTYASSEGFTNQIECLLNITDNEFLLTEDIQEINTIKYINENTTLNESHYSTTVFLNATIRDNVFDSEVTKVFKEEFLYVSERQENPLEPILNNITIDHYLNQKMKLTASTEFDSSELTREIVANKNSKLESDNLKNIVVSIEEPEEKYQGLIWYQLETEA